MCYCKYGRTDIPQGCKLQRAESWRPEEKKESDQVAGISYSVEHGARRDVLLSNSARGACDLCAPGERYVVVCEH